MQLYTKETLIQKLRDLAQMGWVKNGRFGNHGGIGNTLEDFLGISENNLPIPNANEWELKTQKINTSALTTLFHVEPSPRAIKFVPQVLLPMYGWSHGQAGKKYPINEMSFRQTIHGLAYSDRGFIVKVDRPSQRVLVSFDATKVGVKHVAWRTSVEKNVDLQELDPQPYWGFSELEHIAGTKLLNCFYVQAQVKKSGGDEFYWYKKVQILKGFKFSGLLGALEVGKMLVDFDARTGHNHGTKFRLRRNAWAMLYDDITTVIDVDNDIW